MSEFKPMVKMFTDEPSVSLKLKKGGKVHAKHHAKGGSEHGEHGHKAMHHVVAGHMHGAHHAFESEDGKAPKKPSMSERRKAMNPQLYKKGGKVAHKVMGGAMPMAGGMNPGAIPTPMGRTGIAAMAPAQRAARAAMVRKALTGMKKGGDVDHKLIEKLEKELHHHESLPLSKAHHKASGGAIDRDETRTTIEKGAKKFEKTKVVDGDHHDKHHGTKGIKDGVPAGYKHGGHAHGGKVHHISGHPEGSHEHHKAMAKHHAKHHKEGGSAHHAKKAEHHKHMAKMCKGGHYATGGAIPADTHESKNKAKTKFGGTYEGNEHDYVNTEMHEAKKDKAHGTGGVSMSNAGGFKRGGRMHHKATGGVIPAATEKKLKEGHFKHDAVEGGDWENRAADTSTAGVKHTRTGEVKEANAGGYKRGGHASKKAYATGGNVVDSGKAEKMPRHFVSRPVANSLQSGTFKTGGEVKKLAKGGRAEKEEKPNLRLMSTHTGPKGHVAKVYKDKDWGEHRVRFYSPEGKHYPEADYHTDDKEDAHDTAKYALNRYKHGGKAKRYAEGDSVVDDAGTRSTNKAYSNWEKSQREENEADANLIPNMVKRGVNAVKGLFGTPSGSVTKTEKSITVAPAKKRGGSAKKC